MIETTNKYNGAKIESIKINTDEDSNHPNEYCSYEIIIETDKGTIRIWGFHDYTPDLPE